MRSSRLGRVLRMLGRTVAAYVFVVAGLAGLTVGAALLHPAAGWIVGGLSALVLEWRVREPDTSDRATPSSPRSLP